MTTRNAKLSTELQTDDAATSVVVLMVELSVRGCE